ncbi:MAG: DNA alkylation repair protein [Deltaproteobacteria bacterium]|jgi:3-methyladenine DNA glycosylase AlkD|nr:DNA alkylation repair protein [Deltaproteobacteria bacterium]
MSAKNADHAAELTAIFLEAADPEKARHLMRFFKTGVGQYGHGDQFLGLPSVSFVRSQVKIFSGRLALPDCSRLLDSPWHEIRLAAFASMAESAKRMLKGRDLAGLTELVALYDARLERANNWDLVDVSAYHIMGAYWSCSEANAADRRIFLDKWAESGNLWRERASVVSTLALIRRGILEDSFRMAEYFVGHPHDLMHKACGWMLREAGKKNLDALREFLAVFHKRLPRTALRYAIERMTPAERKKWMAK